MALSRFLTIITFIVGIISYCDAYFITVDANAEECFFDRVTSGTRMTLLFEVAEGGFLDIDVKVRAYIYAPIKCLSYFLLYFFFSLIYVLFYILLLLKFAICFLTAR